MTHYGFKRRYRLLKTDEFSSVFSFRHRVYGEWCTFNSQPNTLGYPRLGIVVSKKTARFAVSRNLMRRLIREWFRLKRSALPSRDIVVRINKAFSRTDFAAIRAELDRMARRLEIK